MSSVAETDGVTEAVTSSLSSLSTDGLAGRDDWIVPESDEEDEGQSGHGLYSGWGEYNGEIAPPLSLVQSLYESLDKHGVDALSLLWRCPGRRACEQAGMSSAATAKQSPVTVRQQLPDTSDFDFAGDEFGSQPLKTPRRQPGAAPRGSAKKKSTSFDSILKNMKRTRQLEAQEALQESTVLKQKQANGGRASKLPPNI